MKHLQSFIALCIIVAMVFNACDNPAGSGPQSKPVQINPIDPVYFYVDESGNITETDSGKTVLVTDDQAAVVFYSDDVEDNADRVAFTFEDYTISFFFEKNWYFPISMMMSDSEESYTGVFTPYDYDAQTYGITFVQGEEQETLPDIALSKDIFTQYIDDPELTPSQNLRLRNMHIAMCIYSSIDDFIASDDTLQARSFWSWIKSTAKKVVSHPQIKAAAGVGILVVNGLAYLSGMGYGVAPGSLDVALGLIKDGFYEYGQQTIQVVVDGITYHIQDGVVFQFSDDIILQAFIVPVTGVYLNKSSTSLNVGNAESLLPIITPPEATIKNVYWSSSNTSVATVTSNGTVYGLNAGTATITVTTADGGKKDTCTVTVNAIPVTGISLDKSSVSLAVGATETLIPTITPANATRTVTWSSSNDAVATVTAYGMVTARGVGSATITATADGGKTATCAVTVSSVGITGVTLNKSSISLDVGSSETLTTTITPANVANKSVTWSSSNTAVASVSSNGTVTGIKAGTATITVTTVDGDKTASCAVTVSAVAVTGVSLNKASTNMVVGGTETLYAEMKPANATNKNVTWSSSNAAVATVSSSGMVAGHSAGTATITATTADGGKTATCAVTVSAVAVSVSGVSLNKSNTTIILGGIETLSATIAPANATNQNITWKSNNEAVATVSQDGTVTSISVGSATITVTSADGEKTASCAVTVNPISVSGVSLNKTAATIFVGDTEYLSATVTPANATNKNVTWTSSNTSVAEVSATGTVTAKSQGSATIRATTESNNRTAQCVVTVAPTLDSVTGLFDKLVWVDKYAVSGGNYTLAINADESIRSLGLSYSGNGNITITLIGIGANRTISPSSDGSIFHISSGVTLVLDNNITFRGRSDNNTSLVKVNAGGKLEMKAGSTITGNTAGGIVGEGGGVYVDRGTFTMNGGTISGNTASRSGGGVYVWSGTFTMNGGTISGNTAAEFIGGGVGISSDGTFTMSGGTISGNTATKFTGGGVGMFGGTFTMSGGTISGNTAAERSGGVFVDGTFRIVSPATTGNIHSNNGVGFNNVFKNTGSIFTVNGTDTADY